VSSLLRQYELSECGRDGYPYFWHQETEWEPAIKYPLGRRARNFLMQFLKKQDLGVCRKEDCEALVLRRQINLIREERMAPRFSDGTPNLFAAFEEGEVYECIFECNEVCNVGHWGFWELHVFPESKSVFEMPIVFRQAPMILDEKGWRVDRGALNG